MSVPATGGVPTSGAGEEVVEIPLHGDAAFGALMDALVPEEDKGAPAGQETSTAGEPAEAPAAGGADTGGTGDAAAGQPTAGAGESGGEDTGGDSGQPPGDAGAAAGDPADAAASGGGTDRPATWTASAADLAPQLGELSTKIEEGTTKAYQAAAFKAVKEEHGNYFAALDKHPRLLVGTSVPAIGKEGMETLRDTNDAREWQEAVKSILAAEVRDRAQRELEENRDFLETVHASIELFQKNADLVPGTKDFDVDLANRFATLAKPYELRADGKLQGYSIPVQPIIDQLRTQIASERASQKTAPATPAAAAKAPEGGGTGAPAAPAPAAPAPPEEGPQAGITSKAGNSGNKEDFSTLFGTIGLPNLQI